MVKMSKDLEQEIVEKAADGLTWQELMDGKAKENGAVDDDVLT